LALAKQSLVPLLQIAIKLEKSGPATVGVLVGTEVGTVDAPGTGVLVAVGVAVKVLVGVGVKVLVGV
jgi:hypothetical protein